MPLYEYRCGSCSRVFEAYKRLSDDPSASTCPACGEKAEKLAISLTGGARGSGAPGGGASCGGGSRRSPFS